MKFSPDHIETLRKEYAKINSIDPCAPSYPRICKFLDAMGDEMLIQIKESGIKWLSGLALNRCIKRGI